MSWSDIFYPGNPGRRQEVARLFQEILSDMKDNFYATNKMIALINKEMNGNLDEIYLNRSGTIKENCDILINAMHIIQKYVEKINQKLSEQLEPDLYKELKKAMESTDMKFKEKVAIIKKASTAIVAIGGTIASVAMVAMIQYGIIFTAMVAKIGMVATSVLGSVGVAVFALGVDMIVSAIIGGKERDKLREQIDQLTRIKEKFEPATREYTSTLYKAIARIEIILEDE